jgi:hypothetical protein
VEDTNALERFVSWVESRRDDNLSVFFTPWGEALTRRRYQRAIVRLTNTSHVEKVAIQTNISCRLDWLDDCDKGKLGVWTTYHPSEVARSRFLEQCFELLRRGVRFSVGVVGLKEHTQEIEALRRELPGEVYLWINAYKKIDSYYDMADLQRFENVDPLFQINNQHHVSEGRACLCGESVISVAGNGTVRRCHFISEPIGNIYEDGFAESLRPRPCTNATCGCHIGYVHMPDLKLYSVFGSGVLERVPDLPLGQVDP